MSTAKKNASAKALQSFMASKKKTNAQAEIEWLIACNTNSQRGHVFDQSELMELYSRDDWDAPQGATKTVHLDCHNGNQFEYIVVKRHQTCGYIDEHADHPDYMHTGNQLVDEIRMWQAYADKPESDFLCPILKYFTSKSDKVSATSETMQRNVVIIAQKAVYVSNCETCCYKAAELNGEGSWAAQERYDAMKAFNKKMGWRDALRNSGNSGVIFDYATGKYKAVFIDYAL